MLVCRELVWPVDIFYMLLCRDLVSKMAYLSKEKPRHILKNHHKIHHLTHCYYYIGGYIFFYSFFLRIKVKIIYKRMGWNNIYREGYMFHSSLRKRNRETQKKPEKSTARFWPISNIKKTWDTFRPRHKPKPENTKPKNPNPNPKNQTQKNQPASTTIPPWPG